MSVRTRWTCFLSLFVACSLTVGAVADEYSVEVVNEQAPDNVDPAVAATLRTSGLKIAKGTRTLCTIWLCKELAVDPAAKVTTEVLYPFRAGQLVGVAKFPRKAADFRDQVIPSGTFTLRYGQQPVDGAHVGTSPTRDFLMLIAVDKDTVLAESDAKKLGKLSADTAGSNHPLLLSMQRLQGAAAAPSIRHDEEREWWLVRLDGKSKTGALPLEVVVVGKSKG